MPRPSIFLKWVAETLVQSAGKALLRAVPVVGEFAVEVAERIAERVKEEGKEAELRESLERLVRDSAEETRQAVLDLVQELAAGQPDDLRRVIAAYLSQIPETARQALNRPSDPSGTTIPRNLGLRRPEDILPFLPPRLLRYKPGDRIGDWELTKWLGSGGFGEVWQARNPNMPRARPVALKFCLDHETAGALRNEASLLDRLMHQGTHPGIVKLLGTHLAADPPFLEYEFVEGATLGALIKEWHLSGGPTAAQATEVVLRAAEIIAFAHGLHPPIVHRDLKPANVLIESTGDGPVRLRITDFGIGGLGAGGLREPGTSHGMPLTTAARWACTPLYASPEQLRGEPPDPRDDVHALGVLWYQLLSSDLASGAPTGLAWAEELRRRGMNDAMLHLLASCIEPVAARRPADATALAKSLQKHLDGPRRGGARREPAEAAAFPGLLSAEDLGAVGQVKIGNIRVSAEGSNWPQVEHGDLPPIPEKVLKLEGELEGLKKAIELVQADTHPSFAAARGEIQNLAERERAERAELAAAESDIPQVVMRKLLNRLESEDGQSAAELCHVAPSIPPETLVPVILRLFRLREVTRQLESLSRDYTRAKRSEGSRLKNRAAVVRRVLETEHERDLRSIIKALRQKTPGRPRFPLEAWIALWPSTQVRRYRWDYRETLARAEQAYAELSQKPRATRTRLYLALAGAGLTLLVLIWAFGLQDPNRSAPGRGRFDRIELKRYRIPGQLDKKNGFNLIIYGLAVSPDGQRFASGDSDGKVRVWDFAADKESCVLSGHQGVVFSVAFLPEGGRVVSGSDDGTVRIWDTQSRRQEVCLVNPSGAVVGVSPSPLGDLLLTTSYSAEPGKGGKERGESVRLWDLKSRTQVRAYNSSRPGLPTHVAFFPDGTRFVCSEGESPVYTRDVAGGEISLRFDEPRLLGSPPEPGTPALLARGNGAPIAISPDGKTVITADELPWSPAVVRFWDAETGKEARQCLGHSGSITCLACPPLGGFAVSGSRDGTVRIWDLRRGAEVCCLRGHTEAVECVAASPDGRRVLSAGWDNTICVWRVPDN
jgi:WD40 repeat protein/serine/threonine protein kinase